MFFESFFAFIWIVVFLLCLILWERLTVWLWCLNLWEKLTVWLWINFCACKRWNFGMILYIPLVFALLSNNGVSISEQDHYAQSTLLGPSSEAVQSQIFRTSHLTDVEITRMSLKVGADWDSLAGLMDIPYYEREEIRMNASKFRSFSSKAEAILGNFNDSKFFDRHILEKCFKELDRYDLQIEMLPVKNENGTDVSPPSQTEVAIHDKGENLHLRDERLSSREMYRLSRYVVGQWETLAGFLDIAAEDKENIRLNTLYHDPRSQAEKILSMFNNRKDFSREKLAEALEEIGQLKLIKPVITGEWRNL